MAAIAARLPKGAEELLSRRSVRFRELELAGKTFTEDALLDLLAAEPRLLRRPIIVDGERVVVGAAQTVLAAALLGEEPASGNGETTRAAGSTGRSQAAKGEDQPRRTAGTSGRARVQGGTTGTASRKGKKATS